MFVSRDSRVTPKWNDRRSQAIARRADLLGVEIRRARERDRAEPRDSGAFSSHVCLTISKFNGNVYVVGDSCDLPDAQTQSAYILLFDAGAGKSRLLKSTQHDVTAYHEYVGAHEAQRDDDDDDSGARDVFTSGSVSNITEAALCQQLEHGPIVLSSDEANSLMGTLLDSRAMVSIVAAGLEGESFFFTRPKNSADIPIF